MTEYLGKSQINNTPDSDSRKKKKWLFIATILLLVFYLGAAFLAPMMMKTGHQRFAQMIYKVYRPACHQLAYRSFFLFGEQAIYPLELAGLEGFKTYEEITGFDAGDADAAKNLVGNEQMGYKIALCQRDLAIFSSILLFILIYACFGKRIKPLSWWVWLLLAVIPIGLDGTSQLISQMRLTWLSCLALRESTPFLRLLTGFLFGFLSAWFIIPNIRGDINQAHEAKPNKKTEEPQGLEEKIIHENN